MSGAASFRVAFVLGEFPVTSETFIVSQVADLLDRGIDVEIFTFKSRTGQKLSSLYESRGMAARTVALDPPAGYGPRVLGALPAAFRLLRHSPFALLRSLNVARFGRRATALRVLHAAAAMAGRSFDVVHCHFGDVAVKYLEIRHVLRHTAPMAVTFYGYDVSHVFEHYPATFYDGLKVSSDLFYVMSENMRQRVIARGFPSEKTKVHPVSIDVEAYPFSERTLVPGEPVRLLAVGRLVEKKGFEDLLSALALLRSRTTRALSCTIVGGGPLEQELRGRADKLGLGKTVEFAGPMKIEDIVALMTRMHALVAPSKTANNGDME